MGEGAKRSGKMRRSKMKNAKVILVMKTNWLCIIAVTCGLVLMSSCGGSNASNGSTTPPPAQTPTPPPVFSVSVSVGTSVPSAAASKITTFYDAKASVPVGSIIDTDAEGSIPVLFAGDGNGDPLLLGVSNTDGVLDISTTSIGLVRIALGLVYSTAPLTSDVLSAAISSSP
jgi:hypothetical protein